jgi:hypothetical protein
VCFPLYFLVDSQSKQPVDRLVGFGLMSMEVAFGFCLWTEAALVFSGDA